MDWPKTRSHGGSSAAPSPGVKPEQPPGSVSDVRLTQPLASNKPSPPPDFSKTQVLPVEEMAKVLGPRKVGATRAAFDGARTQRLTASELRLALPRERARWRGWLFACALAAIALGAYATLRGGARPRASSSPAGNTHAVRDAVAARALVAPAPAKPATRAPASSAAHAPQVEPPSQQKKGPSASAPDKRAPQPANLSQRSAIDALATGDAARAASLYTALAARQPHDRALTAAARILQARVARRHEP